MTALGLLIIGVTDTTATEVIHSSFAAATWLALATLGSLTWSTGQAGRSGLRSGLI